MNYLKILTLVFVVLFFAENSKSQNLLYAKIEGRLSSDQRATIKDADSDINKAEKLINQAEKIESKYEKYRDSKKKRKRKKWEKKTWEAKKYRIEAGKKYKNAYSAVTEVYSDIITASKYHFPEDEKVAKALDEAAGNVFAKGEKKLAKYSNKKTKKVLRKIKHKKILSVMEDVKSSFQTSLDKQFEALSLLTKQDEKKKAAEEERLAWEYARDTNTKDSYQDYLTKFSSGKHASNARSKITELEEIAAREAEEAKKKTIGSSNPNGYVFHIQLATSPIRLYDAAKKALYSDPSVVIETGKAGNYKYYVGDFTNYKDAYDFGMRLIRKVPGLFITVYDKEGNQIEVTEDMKPDDLKGKYPR